MPSRFLRVDRATAMLLPPDLNDWVPVDSPARLIVELVEHLDLSSAAVNSKGTGSAQYPPGMMLAMLLHSYSHGIFSSRQIEQSTYEQSKLQSADRTSSSPTSELTLAWAIGKPASIK